jgi:PKD repeat protein
LQDKPKKNLYKILFIVILLSFTIILVGCNWLSFGLLNIIDPQAQVRVNYTGMDLEVGTIALEVYSLNEVEFIGSGFSYKYYSNNVLISDLSKTVGATFYVAPSTSPGTPGPTTTIDLLLYYKEVQDYIKLNPLITEMTCTISLIGTDGAGHDITKSVTVDLPAIQPGVDVTPPVADFTATPESGNAPLTVVFDASILSTDDRGIENYSWDFGDGSTGSGIIVEHTYNTVGTYNVILTVTDYFGNKGYKTKSIQVNYFTEITIIVVAVPASFTSVGGTSTITAYVVDSVGEPVEGVRVIFNTEGGTLSATSGTTDADGKATVTLTVPANATDAAIVYKVTANVGSESGSTSITIHEP